jgi:hypothetical protein
MSGLYATVYTSGSLGKGGPIRLTIHEGSILPFNKLLNLTGLSYIEYVVGETFSEVESPLICMSTGEGFNVVKAIESRVAQFGLYAWVKGLTQSDIKAMYPDKEYAKAYLENVHIIDRYLPENLVKEYHIEGIF